MAVFSKCLNIIMFGHYVGVWSNVDSTAF